MTKPSSKTEAEPSNVMLVTLDDFEGEDRKTMEEYINELTREALMRATTRTRQGVIIKPGPRPKLAPDMAQSEQKFHDYFHTNETELKLFDLTSVRHKYNESIADYIERFRDIKSRCFSLRITDKDLANIAYDGLLDSIKEKLNGQIFLDIDHVLHEALAQESRVDDNSLNTSLYDSAISCVAEPSDDSDCVKNLCNDAITIIAEPNVGSDYLASVDNNAITIIAESSDDSDCVTSLDNDGIAEPSNGLDCVASLENNIIKNIAELSDGSDCITSESEIALSPKTESQIGHVDVGKDNDNVLRDSGEIESKVAMHTYQRPYPEHVDSVPYPQGFEVPNFTKFTGENAMTTIEHIGRFIDQCGKAGSDDLLKLKLFPLSLSNFASTWYSLLAPSSICTWSQMEHEFHDYFKDARLMEKRPVDDSSVTCETISVTSMPKTGIVSDPLPVSPIDVDKKKGKSVIIGDLRPKNRIKNAKAEDHKVAKDGSSNSQKTKKPKLTFEMLMAKYKKGLAGQRFDNQTSDSKRLRSSRRKRFGQTSKKSEPSTIPTPYKPPVVMPWYPYPMSLYGYPFMYYMPWMPQFSTPFHQGWEESPRSVPNHSSNSRQDRFPQKNRSGGSKVKKVWVRKEAKAPEVVAVKEESQDVHVPTGDAAKIVQVEKTEAGAVTVNVGGLTEASGRSNRQTTAAGLTGPRGRSNRGALEKSGKIESNIGASTSTKNIKNHCLAPRKQPQPKWIPSGLSRSQKRRLQRLRAIGWALVFIGQIYPSPSKWHWFVLVAMDYFTKWAEAVPLENITYAEANG
uniref:Retrotransposon protein, putative, Ty3-gypsy subclass n=1 Tax=Oryza sativa subsp. japonica TaxID=39947 RepID=Q75LZ4_ORYSJ|nr:hypothetical protein [Oryza sativa Japonica Group]